MAGGMLENTAAMWSYDVGVRSATAGNREDVLDAITMVSPTETPFLTGLQKVGVRSVLEEWVIDSLQSAGNPENGVTDVRAALEGSDASFEPLQNIKRIGNITHIIRTTLDVTDTQRAVDSIGMADTFAYQLRKALKQLALWAEFAIIHSERRDQTVIGNSGQSPEDGRRMEGILHWAEPDPSGVSTNYLDDDEEGTITDCGSPIGQLSETIFNDHMQAAFAKGLRYDMVYVNYVQKREIVDFCTNVTRNINAAERVQVADILRYEGAFGTQAVMLHRLMPLRQVLTLDESYLQLGFLRPILVTPLARVGDSTKAMIDLEFTLLCRHPGCVGKIIQCSNAYNLTQ